jgi:ubiquinone/menaquinone biosynthesis C-methylase UbiE
MQNERIIREKAMNDLQARYETENKKQEVSEFDSFTIERYEQFGRLLSPAAKRVLDVGCNTGRGGEKLKRENPRLDVYGLDCVKERLNRLPDCYSKGIYGLSTDIPIEDGYFDVIVAGEFLEHLYSRDVDKTICEFQRVLKVGGRLLLTTPNPHYLRNRIFGKTVYGVSHLTQHFPGVLRLRLQMHGFSAVRIFGSGKVSRYLGTRFPIRAVYGSYLIKADKW